MGLQGALSLFLLTCIYLAEVQPKGITDCYYRSWAYFKDKETAKFFPEDIDPQLCSVVSYAAYVIDPDTHAMVGRQKRDLDAKLLKRLNELKKKRPGLKVVISVGGWTHEGKLPLFSNMVSTAERRKAFIDSAIAILNKTDVDGISIDWEYPTMRPTNLVKSGILDDDKKNLAKLLREIRVAFEAFKICNDKPERYLLAMALPSSRKKMAGFDTDAIEKYVDWVNVMAYNMRGQWGTETGCPTLMYGAELPTVPDSIQAWIEAGVSASKINLGMAFYGRGFILSDPNSYGLGASTLKGKVTPPGPYVEEKGVLSYYEICTTPFNHRTPFSQSACGIPYASFNDPISKTSGWMSYEDPESVKFKVRALVNRLGLNGFSVWALDFDDFNGGFCTKDPYPLLRAGVSEMMGGATEELVAADPVQQYHLLPDRSADFGEPM